MLLTLCTTLRRPTALTVAVLAALQGGCQTASPLASSEGTRPIVKAAAVETVAVSAVRSRPAVSQLPVSGLGVERHGERAGLKIPQPVRPTATPVALAEPRAGESSHIEPAGRREPTSLSSSDDRGGPQPSTVRGTAVFIADELASLPPASEFGDVPPRRLGPIEARPLASAPLGHDAPDWRDGKRSSVQSSTRTATQPIRGTQLVGLIDDIVIDPSSRSQPVTDRSTGPREPVEYFPGPALALPTPSSEESLEERTPAGALDEPSSSETDTLAEEAAGDERVVPPLPSAALQPLAAPAMGPHDFELLVEGQRIAEGDYLCRAMLASAAVQSTGWEAAALRQAACESRCAARLLNLTSRVLLFRRAQNGLEAAKTAGELYRSSYSAVELSQLADESVRLLEEELAAAEDARDKGVLGERPVLSLQSRLAEARAMATRTRHTVATTQTQLAAAAGLPTGSRLATTGPLLQPPTLSGASPSEAADLAIRQRPELNLLRTVLCSLDEETLPVARGVVGGLDPALGVDASESSCRLLRIFRKGDGAAREVALRRSQLMAALAEGERLAAAEARSAAE